MGNQTASLFLFFLYYSMKESRNSPRTALKEYTLGSNSSNNSNIWHINLENLLWIFDFYGLTIGAILTMCISKILETLHFRHICSCFILPQKSYLTLSWDQQHPYLLLLIIPAQGKLRYHHTHGKACGYNYGVYYVLFSSNKVLIVLSTWLWGGRQCYKFSRPGKNMRGYNFFGELC